MKRFAASLMSVVIAGSVLTATAGIITFESVPQKYWEANGSQDLGDYYDGVTFNSPATVLTGDSYNTWAFPPHSGTSVLYASNSRLDIALDQPTDYMSFWYTVSNDNLDVYAYDVEGTTVAKKTVKDNLSWSSELTLSSDIAFSSVSLSSDDGFFTIDDLSAENISGEARGVPSPATFAMILFGLSTLGIIRKRK